MPCPCCFQCFSPWSTARIELDPSETPRMPADRSLLASPAALDSLCTPAGLVSQTVKARKQKKNYIPAERGLQGEVASHTLAARLSLITLWTYVNSVPMASDIASKSSTHAFGIY